MEHLKDPFDEDLGLVANIIQGYRMSSERQSINLFVTEAIPR